MLEEQRTVEDPRESSRLCYSCLPSPMTVEYKLGQHDLLKEEKKHL
jgi:hypothetical protein